jgi:hypothetical protein
MKSHQIDKRAIQLYEWFRQLPVDEQITARQFPGGYRNGWDIAACGKLQDMGVIQFRRKNSCAVNKYWFTGNPDGKTMSRV